MKKLSRRPGERVNRNVSGDNYRDGVENWTVDVLRRCKNYMIQIVLLTLAVTQFPENIFDHYERAIDHDAKIDRADRQQVGRNIVCVQKNEREQKSERNCHRNDESRADADQETNQNDENQNHASKQIRLDSIGGEFYEVAAVVKRPHLDVRRQDVLVDLFGFFFDALQHGLRLFTAAH